MVLPVKFVQSEFWNTGVDTDPVGGNTGNVDLTGLLDEIFPTTNSDFIGQPTGQFFQKIFIENTGITVGDNISNAKIYFNNVMYPDQVSFAFEKVASDSGDNPTGFPSGYATGDFQTPLGIINAVLSPDTGLDTGAILGIWLLQKIPPNLTTQTGATATLGIIGEI